MTTSLALFVDALSSAHLNTYPNVNANSGATASQVLPGFNNDATTTRYAVFSILETGDVINSNHNADSGLATVVGEVQKYPRALFTGTEEWEHDIDNGYSSVLYDANDTFGLGR